MRIWTTSLILVFCACSKSEETTEEEVDTSGCLVVGANGQVEEGTEGSNGSCTNTTVIQPAKETVASPGNKAPTAMLTCTKSTLVACSGCSLPVVACTGPSDYQDSDPEGHGVNIKFETDCISGSPALSYDGTPSGQITGQLATTQTDNCTLNLKFCDDRKPSICGVTTSVAVKVQSSRLIDVAFSNPAWVDQCQLKVPVIVNREGTAPLADLATYQGEVDDDVTGVSFSSVSASGSTLSLDLKKEMSAAGSYQVEFSATSSFGNAIVGNTSFAISSQAVSEYASREVPVSLTAENIPTEGRQPPPAGCSLCSGDSLHVNVGKNTVCFSAGAGKVRCAGESASGRLGDGQSATDKANPVYVLSSGSDQLNAHLTGAVSFHQYASHGCIVLSSGELQCFGWGTRGQLGQGESSSEVNPQFVLTSGTDQSANRLTGVVQVATGFYHSCAILDSTNVMCWGDNQFNSDGNALGIGLSGGSADVERLNPEYVLATGSDQSTNRLTGAAQLSLGFDFSCALITSGEVMCWGENSHGQLGNGTLTDANNPTYVLSSGTNQSAYHLDDVRQIACRDFGCCALLASSEVMCWGSQKDGVLGNGYAMDGKVVNPVYVLASGTDQSVDRLSGVVAISGGVAHSCAMLKNTEAVCWGVGSNGNIGDGLSDSANPNPRFVLDSGTDQSLNRLTGVVAIDAGDSSSCAALSSGKLKCWGSELSGGLGNGQSSGSELNPVYILSSGTDQSTNHEMITPPTCTNLVVD